MIKWLAIIPIATLGAECCSLTIEGTGGYRLDQLKADTNLYIHADHPLKRELLYSTEIRERNLSIFETGIAARGTLNAAFVKGFYNHGWIVHGHFSEVRSSTLLPFVDTQASINWGQTNDVSLGLGYRYSLFCLFELSPCFGWSYDDQRTSINQAVTNGESSPFLNGLKYKNHWQGPWIGLETAFCFLFLDVRAGYEFHWTAWQGDRVLSERDLFDVTFSDKRHATGVGNRAYCQANYHFFPFLHIGVSFAYQDRVVKHGDLAPRIKDFFIVLPHRHVRSTVPKASWHSYEYQVNLGIDF